MRLLAIETSCDDTGVALMDRGRVVAQALSSQVDVHALFGGVVPELAARKHLEALYPLTIKVLEEGGVTLASLDCIGVTVKPGLVPSLLVGLSFAKALAFGKGLPLVGVDHLEAHVFSIFLERRVGFPFVALVVSGGHTSLFLVKDYGDMALVGQTRDDAAGEAFDKVAKLLNLGYPGGPIIDRMAREGDPNAINFPRPMLGKGWDFSFSGLKTAVVQYVREHGDKLKDSWHLADLVASFQQAVVDVLVEKTVDAARRLDVSRIVVAGGVAANSALRKTMEARAGEEGMEVHFPPLSLCMDNAAMVAFVAAYRFAWGEQHSLDLDVSSRATYPKVKL